MAEEALEAVVANVQQQIDGRDSSMLRVCAVCRPLWCVPGEDAI